MKSNSVGVLGHGDGLWDWNLVSDRIHFSPGWRSLVGCDEHQVGNTPDAWFQRIHPEDLAAVKRVLEGAMTAGPDEFELRHRMLHQDGSYRWVSCRGVVQWDGEGEAVRISGCHADVTAQAASDPQTGLPNRLLMLERLSRSIERAARYPGFHFAVLGIELARPDSPEESLAGADPLLSAVARRLETCLRAREEHPTLRNNDLVARLEGNQFVILLDGLKELGHAAVAADRILATVLAPYRIGAREIRVSASVGIALSATVYERAEDALRDTDTALHRASLLGGNRCEVFDTAVLRSVQTELRLESDFGGAIERGEFLVFYQPIVSLSSNQILGFEALARWRHPVLGLIPPVEFVPIAEKVGFIAPLGNWVLREACRQLQVWQQELPTPRNLWVSVNLSSAQLSDPGLVDDIAEALRDAALEPRCLVLELTESLAMQNPTGVQTLLMQLRARGIRISVDDFGTGHSALAHLRQLPLDLLKIDGSFIRGIEANKDMKSILAAVTAMTRELGLQLVAEGIEKQEQLELLRSLGCDAGQGYLFSKPVDSETAAALFKTGLTPSQSEPPAPRTVHVERGQPPRTLKGAYAAAAVLAVVASVGLPGYFKQQPVELPAAPAPPRLPAAAAPPVPQLPDETPQGPPLPVSPASQASPVSPVSPVSPGAGRRLDNAGNTERAASAPTIIASTAPVAPATKAVPITPPAAGAPAAPTSLASLLVVHQHRIGYCRGVLVVSAAGISYVPGEADQRKDAFAFAHDQFLHELKDDSLTIRSTDRAYRFKAADATGRDSQLAELVQSLTRLRK
jgi:diguanylate cyclase (GGDEF)-like protein